MADVIDIAMRAFTLPVCGSILLNGLDDLFIDLNYYFRGLFHDADARIRVKDLKDTPPKRIALLVPAWQEAGVIRQMLELNLRTLDYPTQYYDIFVGTYRNDTATQKKVDEVARRVPNVHKVVTPHDGPTVKADNLNWVYQGIQMLEKQRGQRFDILLMHDAEDIIHPLALRLYNYLIPEHDFVQTPVFPLESPWYKFVAATYKDEFTEHHLKDMLVREHIGGLVPSAGVGSGFARDAFEDIALAHSQEAFNVKSLTEDYEIGLKFRLAGKKAYFARRAVQKVVEVEKGIFRKRKVRMVEDEYIATREFFPDSFSFAVRQRSRWVLGIAIQGWEQVGWSGPPPVLYCLWRDRKALFTNFFSVFAYLVLLYCIGRYALGAVTGNPWSIENIFPPGTLLWWLVMANTLVLVWRVAMKFITVYKVYGVLHGVLSVPRFFVANIINFMATSKAVRQYINHKITGEPLRWLKTDHVFPTLDALETFHKRLGDLLVDRDGLTEAQLREALSLQGRTRLKLGEVCTVTGMATQRQVAEALAEQFELVVCEPQPYAIPLELLERVPEEIAERLGVLPLSREDDAVVVATSEPPEEDSTVELEALLGTGVRFEFTLARTLEAARARAYRRLGLEVEGEARPKPLGEALVEAGALSPERLEEALAEQGASGEFLGELLRRRGWVSPEALTRALEARLALPLRPLEPGELCLETLARLGYGFCALHRVVPLRALDGAALPLAMAQRLHPQTLEELRERLDRVLVPQLSPATDVLLALASGGAALAASGGVLPSASVDGAELAVLTEGGWSLEHCLALLERARQQGAAPLDQLVADGAMEAVAAARLRARALGVVYAGDLDESGTIALGLPPGMDVSSRGLRVSRTEGGLLLEAPRPAAWMTAEVATLYPGRAIRWRVAAVREPAARDDEITESVLQQLGAA
jgi:adsorption protein B